MTTDIYELEETDLQSNRHVLMLFIDGVGLAPAGPDNPWGYLPTNNLRKLLPGGLTSASIGVTTSQATLVALDACLGVPGVPQSASGQTAILTGLNAPRLIGSHLSGYPNQSLIKLLQEHGLFQRLQSKGCRTTFANAFYDHYWDEYPAGPHSATTEAALTAGLSIRGEAELLCGHAIYQDITNQLLRQRGLLHLPLVTPRLAGERLAAISARHQFTLFEFFQTDITAHKQQRIRLERYIQQFDQLVGSVLAHTDLQNTWVVLISDHGNSEDLSNQSHTMNLVPGLSIGANSSAARAWRSIADPASDIVRWLTL